MSGHEPGTSLLDILPKGDFSKQALSTCKTLDASLCDPFMKVNAAVRDKIGVDPETYARFIAFAKSMPVIRCSISIRGIVRL